MAISTERKTWMRNNCSNFLYAFIPKASLKYFTQFGSVIATKRENQQWMMNNIAIKEKVTYQEVETLLSNYIQEIYGQTPKDILIALARGESVGGKNWRKGIYGIGAVDTVDDINDAALTFTNGYKVDLTTGHILSSSGKRVSTTKNEIYTVEKIPFGTGATQYLNQRIKSGVAYTGKGFSLKSKAVFLKSQYDEVLSGKSKTGIKVYYVVDMQNYGSTTTNAAGKAVAAEDGEIWGNSAVWETVLGKLLDWLLKLLGVTTGPSAEDTVINQSVDGFTPEVSNSSNTMSMASVGLLAGGLLLAVNMGDSGKKKTKNKRNK
ncbi:MAG: hypothetical protein ACI30B_07605 [Paludibacteraceae bacterium]